MSTPPSSVHEVKTLVLSRHPIIVIETPEEARTDELLLGRTGKRCRTCGMGH